ncbi:MAG: type II secretion system F family protein [Anaerolineae bacterium]|jgi:tight adherence protein C|nr:type II secretion system F family protein [Anaerolineae bacterium]
MDTTLILFIVGLAVLVIGGFLAYNATRETDGTADPLQKRLDSYGLNDLPESLEKIELSLSFKDRILRPIIKFLSNVAARFTPQSQLDEARKLLERANSTQEPGAFVLSRLFYMLFAMTVGIVAFFVVGVTNPTPTNALLYTAGLTFLGYMQPVSALKGRIRKRQEAFLRALPDALDLLVICVEAGLGFDQAMGKVYEKWDNDLALAFGRVLKEVQLGKLRREALRDLAERVDVPDFNAFTAAIIQADQLGVSMGNILRVQADQMRIKRRQRAQEKAQQAPVKIMVPLVFLIFPSIWIVLLGPAAISVKNTFGGFG